MSFKKIPARGRQHSKVETIEYRPNSDDLGADTADWAAFKRELYRNSRPNGKGGRTVGQSYRERIEASVGKAKSVLRKAGLPDAASVYWTRSKPNEWTTTAPDLADWKRGCAIHVYVQQLGYEYDSTEDRAARILNLAAVFNANEGEAKNQALADLIDLIRLDEIYNKITTQATEAAREKALRVMDEAAEFMAKKYEGKTAGWILRQGKFSLSDHPQDLSGGGWFYRDGNHIVGWDAKKGRQRMTIESRFRHKLEDAVRKLATAPLKPGK